MDTDFHDLLDRFTSLGGVATNICQRAGEYGRGIFPVDSSRRARIMTPKNLLIDVSDICVDGDEIVIKDNSGHTAKEVAFLERYYNDYSWGNEGNSDSAAFLKFIVSLPESVQKQLLSNGFVDASLLSYREDNDHLLKRFVSERSVRFGDRNVLAPVWEFVNHSSFVPPLRITPSGVETPPIEPGFGEILFKYSGKNSPVGMWKKYGFACNCIVAYSVPFKVDIGDHSLAISCSGQLGFTSQDKKNVSVVGDILSIKSLPVGCLSIGLPFANFKMILTSVGLSVGVVNRLFPKIREANLKARRDLIDKLQAHGFGAQTELYKALEYEIGLIEGSLNG